MVWVTITGAGTTTATKFFGDAMNKISNLFNDGVDVDTVKLNSIFEVTASKFKIRDVSDETKEAEFIVSAIATGTTRTITIPNANVDLTGVTHTTDTLGVFAATTSAQLLGVLSDETGSGLVVFGTSPTIVTPTIASFTNATHDHSNAAGGGTFASTNLSDASAIVLITKTNIFGDFDQQFFHDRLRIQNPLDTFDYIFSSDAITADRTINLPLLTGDITLGDRLTALEYTIGDETTVLGTGTEKLTIRIPFDFTITEARCSTAIAGTGAALLTVDINDDTTSIFSTVLTQDAGTSTSVGATTPAVLTSTPLDVVDNSEITVDIDTIDTDNVAAGLKITLIGYKTP